MYRPKRILTLGKYLILTVVVKVGQVKAAEYGCLTTNNMEALAGQNSSLVVNINITIQMGMLEKYRLNRSI